MVECFVNPIVKLDLPLHNGTLLIRIRRGLSSSRQKTNHKQIIFNFWVHLLIGYDQR